MTLKKNQLHYKLKKPVEILSYVTIVKGLFQIPLTIISMRDMLDTNKKDPNKIGVPNLVSMYHDNKNGNLLLIYPIPDKDYKCIIQGQRTIQQ